MANIIKTCPSCNGSLEITTLKCNQCGMELKSSFELGVFEQLSNEHYDFLMMFLKHRGNLKNLQSELDISYPTAKKRLDELLLSLGIESPEYSNENQEVIDVKNIFIDRGSKKASDIIKAKLIDNGGHAVVHTARGLPCEIWAAPDGTSFISNKLPIKPPYEYAVFDVIVDLLLSNGGKARKGNGRNYKLGDSECDETTVVGAVAISRGYTAGKSVFDPVFVLAAVLEWADIAHNERGELVLTPAYRSML